MDELDNYAQSNNYNRSEAIREAIRRLVHSRDDIRVNKPIIVSDFSKSRQAKGLLSRKL